MILWLGFGGLWCRTGLAAAAEDGHDIVAPGTPNPRRVGYLSPSLFPRLQLKADAGGDETHRRLSHEGGGEDDGCLKAECQGATW